MKNLDNIYDAFENLCLFLSAEVNDIESCDDFVNAKDALEKLYIIIEQGEI